MEIRDRLQVTIKQYGLTATSFADKIGVQRSSISHILSGRNKPSIDFIVKLNDVFPDLDIAWLITGRSNDTNNTLPIIEVTTQKDKVYYRDEQVKSAIVSRKIKRVITFYDDNSIEEFINNQQ
jgi:transcriptional regulator with XRE-family HTH domain